MGINLILILLWFFFSLKVLMYLNFTIDVSSGDLLIFIFLPVLPSILNCSLLQNCFFLFLAYNFSYFYEAIMFILNSHSLDTLILFF